MPNENFKNLNEDLLVSLVDEFLEPFGLDSNFDSDFYYDPKDNRVYFTIIMTERSDRLFTQFISNEFQFVPPNIFIMSLLHEVGHAYTMPTLSKREIKKDHITKKCIEHEFAKTNSDEIYCQYFNLKIEKVATEWAVRYYQANLERCAKFYSIFEKALHAEFERLGVTE